MANRRGYYPKESTGGGGGDTFSPSLLIVGSGVVTIQNMGDHNKWRSGGLEYFKRGTNITLDETSAYTTATNVPSDGRFTLKAGSVYELYGVQKLSASTLYVAFAWYNADTNVRIGTYGGGGTGGNLEANVTDVPSMCIVPCAVDTRVELRRGGSSGGKADYFGNMSLSGTVAKIKEICLI